MVAPFACSLEIFDPQNASLPRQFPIPPCRKLKCVAFELKLSFYEVAAVPLCAQKKSPLNQCVQGGHLHLRFEPIMPLIDKGRAGATAARDRGRHPAQRAHRRRWADRVRPRVPAWRRGHRVEVGRAAPTCLACAASGSRCAIPPASPCSGSAVARWRGARRQYPETRVRSPRPPQAYSRHAPKLVVVIVVIIVVSIMLINNDAPGTAAAQQLTYCRAAGTSCRVGVAADNARGHLRNEDQIPRGVGRY
jgi:hypothetical protein